MKALPLHAIVRLAPQARLRNKGLWLAVDKIIHYYDIQIGYFQDAIARGNSDQENVSCVKPDSQERKACALCRLRQYVTAEQQVTANIEVFDFRAIAKIHVGEYGAETFDRCRLCRIDSRCSARHKEKVFRDGAIQGGEELLRTERAKERGIDRVNISKSDRSVRWVDKVCAYLKPCPWSEEYDPARRVFVEEIRRQQVRCGESVWNAVPVDLTVAGGRWGTCYVVGVSQKTPEGVYLGQDIRRSGAGRFEHLRSSRSSHWVKNEC